MCTRRMPVDICVKIAISATRDHLPRGDTLAPNRQCPLVAGTTVLLYSITVVLKLSHSVECHNKAYRIRRNYRIVYMDGLNDQLNNSHISGNFGSGQLVNHISYADDMCLLSFSSAGMQKLLYICDQYSNDHDLIYNSKKTMRMCFTPKSCKSYECKLSLNQ